MKTFIKEEREKRKIQQKDLAEELNIAKSTLATYENTDRDPPLDILCKIADKFDTSLDMLVRGKEKDRPKGRSLDEAVRIFKNLPAPELEMLLALGAFLQYRKEFPERPGQEKEETP